MVMYKAGVAAKVIFYLELMLLYNLMMFVAECKMINLESIEGRTIY